MKLLLCAASRTVSLDIVRLDLCGLFWGLCWTPADKTPQLDDFRNWFCADIPTCASIGPGQAVVTHLGPRPASFMLRLTSNFLSCYRVVKYTLRWFSVCNTDRCEKFLIKRRRVYVILLWREAVRQVCYLHPTAYRCVLEIILLAAPDMQARLSPHADVFLWCKSPCLHMYDSKTSAFLKSGSDETS